MKKCPFCHEEIMDDAIKCRYCGEFIEKETVNIVPPITILPSNTNKSKSSWITKIFLFILLSILVSGLAARFTNSRSFPFLILAIVLGSIAGLIIAIRSAQGNKERAKLLFAIIMPLFISSILFFLPAYDTYKNIRIADKRAREEQISLNVQKEKDRQYALEHIEESYQKAILLISENKLIEAKSILGKILEVNPEYKNTKELLIVNNNKISEIETSNKKEAASKGIIDADKLSQSNSCNDMDRAIALCEDALKVFPDSTRAKTIIQYAKIEKLRCFSGNSEIQMAIDIVKYNPLTLHISIKNVSAISRHANPNNFTLVTVTGNSYSVSSETYGLSKYFDAVDLQPGTSTSGGLIFDTNDKPLKIVYSEMLGTAIEKIFPFK